MLSQNTLLLVISLVALSVFVYFMLQNKEGFESENNAMNKTIEKYLKDNKGSTSESETISRKDIEKAARAAAVQYCPVPPDYNPSQYIKKSEIEKEQRCPEMPDLKDYVLKTSIPPKQDCAPCICPKVNVMAEMCNKDDEKLVCPSCEPCGFEQCKDVVECPSPDAIASEISKDNLDRYLRGLVVEKDYKQIYHIKSLLRGFKTPQDDILKLREENKELKFEIQNLKRDLQRTKMGEINKKVSSGVVSNNNNNKKNNNSPVVDYAEKCENNRVNDWYNVAGIIGSPFNGMKK